MNKATDSGFKDTPQWFTGVVEDINDPSELGRVRVRCFGYHTAEKELELGGIPTNMLPWSHVMMPVTSASMSGIGHSPTGLLQGAWVVGFFRDGNARQDSFVIGTLPSISTNVANPDVGFSDPEGLYPKRTRINEPDTPPPARSNYTRSQPYISKEDERQEKIETAVPPKMETIVPNKPDTYYERKTWDNHKLEEIIQPSYPYNHVRESQSGHIQEVDDTPGAERISEYHTSGTYTEVIANGDKTVTVVGDEYEVTFKSKNMYVKGNLNLTVDGNMHTLVKKDYILEVEGDKTEYVKGNRKSKIGLNEFIEVDEERSINVAKNFTSRIGGLELRDCVGNSTTNITGDYNMTIAGKSEESITGNHNLSCMGTLTMASDGNFTISSSSTTKIDTQSDIDIDAQNNIVITTPANVDVDGARIDLN
jgi:hypothetical protein